MNSEQLEEARAFAKNLPFRRLQVADGPLLDQCQEHLDRLLAYIDDAMTGKAYVIPEASPLGDVAPKVMEEWSKPGEVEPLKPDPPHRVTHLTEAAKKRSHHKKKQ